MGILLVIILICLSITGVAQRLLTGRVIDEFTKRPIKTAVISIEGKDSKTYTNYLGYFQIQIDSSDVLIVENVSHEALSFKVPSGTNCIIPLKLLPISIHQNGMDVFYRFIGQNMKYPAEAKNIKIKEMYTLLLI